MDRGQVLSRPSLFRQYGGRRKRSLMPSRSRCLVTNVFHKPPDTRMWEDLCGYISVVSKAVGQLKKCTPSSNRRYLFILLVGMSDHTTVAVRSCGRPSAKATRTTCHTQVSVSSCARLLATRLASASHKVFTTVRWSVNPTTTCTDFGTDFGTDVGTDDGTDFGTDDQRHGFCKHCWHWRRGWRHMDPGGWVWVEGCPG